MFLQTQRLQHQIDSKDPVRSKFESKIPVCTSYVLASLQYQNNIANYHKNIMEMCLLLFESAEPLTMQNIANLDVALIAQLWMPVEFVGDYITQRLCLKLIVAVLKHLSVEERQTKVSEAKLNENLEKLILKLTADPLNFEKISRELLNLYNTTLTSNCTIFSLYCTKALFGKSQLFKPDKVTNFWIDFNYTSKSVSLLCQLNQSEGKQEEFYIKIKIDKLQIENQFDCFVFTTGPASFSTTVSPQLLNARVAVFTLPKNQLDRLKANSDLIDYYNTFSYSSSEASTPNTIVKYLADLNVDSPLTPNTENYFDNIRMKLPTVKLHKYDSVQKDCPKNDDPMVENNRTPISDLVSKIEYLPNYVAPSVKEIDNNKCVNTTTIDDDAIFKKPAIPIKFKVKKQNQSVSKMMNKMRRKSINSSYTKKKIDSTLTNNLEQQNVAITSIQVCRNTFHTFSNTDPSLKQENVHNYQQQLKEENSILGISLQEISNDSTCAAYKPNEETNTNKSTDCKTIASIQPKLSKNLLQPHTKQSEIQQNSKVSSPVQSVFPIQRSPKLAESTQISQSLDNITDCISLSQQNSNNSHSNRSLITNEQSRDDENHLTSLESSDNDSQEQKKIINNKNVSSITLQPFSCDGLQDVTIDLENGASEIPKDTSRRFFKYKHLPDYSSTVTTNVKRKSNKKTSNTMEKNPKKKSVNLVKPLNFVNDSSSNYNEPVLESLENKNSTKNNILVNKEAGFSNQRIKAVEDLNIINDTHTNFVPKTIRRRTNKRKTLLKEVEAPNVVPYSIWKMNRKQKNNIEAINLSETETPLDTFDQLKAENISHKEKKRKRRSNSSSKSIRTFYFSETDDEKESAQDRSPVKYKLRSSLHRETVRREQPDDISTSPIAVPFEIAQRKTRSLSRESILTPLQMSLDSDCLDVMDGSQYPNNFNPLNETTTINLVSPVYEDLDDGISEDPLECHTSQLPKVYNPLAEVCHKEGSPLPEQISGSEEENEQLTVPPGFRQTLESQNAKISCNDPILEDVSSIPKTFEFVEEPLQILADEITPSSQSADISVNLEAEAIEQETYENQLTVQRHVTSPLRKRTHLMENEDSSVAKIPALTNYKSLKNYDQLLPEFTKKLTNEKDRLLNKMKAKFNEDILNNLNNTVETLTKEIDNNEMVIKGEQEKLLSVLQSLELHHTKLQKNQSELEKIHGQIIEHAQTQIYDDNIRKIDEMHKDTERDLIAYADFVKRDQWQIFSESIVYNIKERITEYLDI